MNDCERYYELISRMADEELSSNERADLSAHMEQCSECNAMYAVFAQLSEIISEDTEELPEGLHESMMADIRRAAMVKKNRFRLTAPIRNTIAAAACVALVILANRVISPASKSESSVIRSNPAEVFDTITATEATPAIAPPAVNIQPTPVPTPRISPVLGNGEPYSTPLPSTMPIATAPPQDIYDGSHAPANTPAQYTQPPQNVPAPIQPPSTANQGVQQGRSADKSIPEAQPSNTPKTVSPSISVNVTPQPQQEMESTKAPEQTHSKQAEIPSQTQPAESVEQDTTKAETVPLETGAQQTAEEDELSLEQGTSQENNSLFNFAILPPAPDESADLEPTPEAAEDTQRDESPSTDNTPAQSPSPSAEPLPPVNNIDISGKKQLEELIKLLQMSATPQPTNTPEIQANKALDEPTSTPQATEVPTPRISKIYSISFSGEALDYYKTAELIFYDNKTVSVTLKKEAAKDESFIASADAQTIENYLLSLMSVTTPSPTPTEGVEIENAGQDDK